jgi:hypothetical protein
MSNLLVVKDKVSRYAREVFNIVQLDDDGDLIIPYESTRVFIRVIEREVAAENEPFWNDNQLSRTAVYVWAPTIFDVKPSNELYKWVATEGQNWMLGGTRVVLGDDGECTLLFVYTMSGETLDPGEFKNGVMSINIYYWDKQGMYVSAIQYTKNDIATERKICRSVEVVPDEMTCTDFNSGKQRAFEYDTFTGRYEEARN